MSLHRVQTLVRLFREKERWDAKGILSDADALARRGEGEWLPTAWDNSDPSPGTHGVDIHPHLLKLNRGRALVRSTDTAVFSASNRMIGFGASSFLLNYNDELLNLRQHPFYRRKPWARPFPWLPEPVHSQGPLFLLHAAWSHNNYYHFLIDLLPKLGIFLSCRRMDSDSIPILTTVDATSSYRSEVLTRTGADLRVQQPDPVLHISADTLYVVALGRTRHDLSAHAVRYLRSLFSKEINDNAAPRRRIFVRRGIQPRRPLRNEDEVANALAARGYETVQPETLSVAEQARLFASAEVVVGQHGAGLTNTAFCRQGTTVVEIFSPPWHDPHYERITQHVSGNYIPFQCAGAPDHSLRVDVGALLSTLTERGLA